MTVSNILVVPVVFNIVLAMENGTNIESPETLSGH